MGAVDQSRIDHDDVASAHRHVDLVRARCEGDIVRVLHFRERGVVSIDEVVERVRPAMGAGDQPQAAVLSRGIGQVEEERDLGDAVLPRDRVLPAPPVLVPEERRPARRLADDVAGRETRAAKAQAPEHVPEPGMGDERCERRVVGNRDQAPLRAPLRAVIGADRGQRGARRPPGRPERIGIQHAGNAAEAVGRESVPRRLRIPRLRIPRRRARAGRVVHEIVPMSSPGPLAADWARPTVACGQPSIQEPEPAPPGLIVRVGHPAGK